MPHIPTADAFAAAGDALARHVVKTYDVAIDVSDVPAPFKGDLDGRRIVVGRGSDPEERLFLVAHLFGHTVQWNTCDRSRRLGMTMPSNPDAALLDALQAYEREACRYSQAALREAGVTAFDQWLADYSACDLAFLRHLYVTGERREFRRFWLAGQPLIEPLAIPPFTPRCWRRRTQAIVL
ncbi:MAG: hypothetical protein ACKOSQ_07950 [Planctomycetaceae bacterium]